MHLTLTALTALPSTKTARRTSGWGFTAEPRSWMLYTATPREQDRARGRCEHQIDTRYVFYIWECGELRLQYLPEFA